MADHRELTIGELGDRIDEIRADFKEFRTQYVRADIWELQRVNVGERLGDMDSKISNVEADLRAGIRAINDKTDRIEQEQEKRFRSAVTLALSSLVFPIIIGGVLLVFRLLATGTP